MVVDEESFALNASDLRQFVYCPRIIYFRYCAPVRPPPTYKMTEGRLQHERVEDLEHRRTLHAYGLSDGERAFDVRIASERLGISGILDMVIVRRHEVIPVEFKHTSEIPRAPREPTRFPRLRPGPAPSLPKGQAPAGRSSAADGDAEEARSTEASEEAPIGDGREVDLHHKYQLAAYCLLAEERWEKPARRCFVNYVPTRMVAEVEITPGARRYVTRLIREMRSVIAAQRMPEGTRRVGRCQECEYRRFCNDVD